MAAHLLGGRLAIASGVGGWGLAVHDGEACLATAIRLSLRGQGAASPVLHSTFCVPRRTNRPAKGRRRAETVR
jgi:hypothetical protein